MAFCYFFEYLSSEGGILHPKKITDINILKKMKKMKKQKVVKMNISLEREFFELLQEKAKQDYVRVATWVKQYLMKTLLEKNNSDNKSLTKNETGMER